MVDADRNSPTISNTAEGERRSSVVPPKRLTRSQLRVLTLLANNRPIFTAGAFGETIATSVPYLKRFARPITLHILHNRGWIEPGDRLGFIEATVAFALKRPELAKDLRPALRRLLDA